MAGVRQHILPRFLLKGFMSRSGDGNNFFSWVYNKNGRVYESNIINIAVEKNYYGNGGEGSVDHEMTDLETNFAELVDGLRAIHNSMSVVDRRIPEFITHLVIRTKHLRDSLHESSEFVIGQLLAFFADYNNVKMFIINNMEIVKKAMEEKLDEINLPASQKIILLRMMMALLPTVLNGKQKEMQFIFNFMRDKITTSMPSIAKDGHISALSKQLVPEPRVEDYRELDWYVCNMKEPLLFGDVGCIFETLGSKKYTSITMKKDKVINAFLPISTHKLLIGTSLSSCPDVKSIRINETISKMSREFFICYKKSPDFLRYLSAIGTEAEMMSKEELMMIAKISLGREKVK